LQKAYAQFQNDEIAAHLAEVLWVSGRSEEASDTFNEIKQNYPDSDYIEYLQRLFGESTE
jgi:thioredoxin-like negative regulator of GroEL